MNITIPVFSTIEEPAVCVDTSTWYIGAEIASPLITEEHEVGKAVHITANLNMLKSLANNIVYKFRHNPRISYDDCFQEAFLAAWEAIDSYDPSYGAKMSTHIYIKANAAVREYAKRNLSIFKGTPSYTLYRAYLDCADNLSVDNLMERGLTYHQALDVIGFYTNGNIDIEEAYNSYDDGAYWQLEEVEHNAYPFDFAKYLTQEEADALRLAYGFSESVQTTFKSRKSRDYYHDKAMMKLHAVRGIEQYLDYLR